MASSVPRQSKPLGHSSKKTIWLEPRRSMRRPGMRLPAIPASARGRACRPTLTASDHPKIRSERVIRADKAYQERPPGGRPPRSPGAGFCAWRGGCGAGRLTSSSCRRSRAARGRSQSVYLRGEAATAPKTPNTGLDDAGSACSSIGSGAGSLGHVEITDLSSYPPSPERRGRRIGGFLRFRNRHIDRRPEIYVLAEQNPAVSLASCAGCWMRPPSALLGGYTARCFWCSACEKPVQ